MTDEEKASIRRYLSEESDEERAYLDRMSTSGFQGSTSASPSTLDALLWEDEITSRQHALAKERLRVIESDPGWTRRFLAKCDQLLKELK